MGAAAILLSLALIGAGAAPSVEPRVAKILGAGEVLATTAEARAAALKSLKALQPAADQPAEVHFAFALAMMRQNRPSEALAGVGRAIAKQPDYLPARRLRVIVLLSQKQNTTALTELEALASRLPPIEEGTPSPAGQDAAKFLGTVIAFFDGPGESLIRAPARAANKSRVEKAILAPYIASYQEGVDTVRDAFSKESGSDATPEDVKAGLSQATAKVASRKEAVDRARNEAAARGDKLKEDLNRQWNALVEKMQQMTAELQNQIIREATLQQNYLDAVAQYRASLRASKDKDEPIVNRETPSSVQWSITANQINGELAGVQRAAQFLAQNIDAMKVQMKALSIQGQEAGLSFAMEEQRLQEQAESLDSKKQKLDKNAAAQTKKYNEHKAAFSTYFVFSYEDEKDRLVESLKASR